MSIERRVDKYVLFPHSGMLFSSKTKEPEVHTSASMMDPTNNGTPRVLVLVDHFGDHPCPTFAEDLEGQTVGRGIRDSSISPS